MEPSIPPLVAVHATLALISLALGPVQFLRRRRDRAHRIIGRTWVAAMALTCLTSFAIVPDGFTWLHGLAAFTLVSITLGVVCIRRGNVRGHVRNMIGSYLGTSIAFVFAVLMPNRLIPTLLREDPFLIAGAASAVVVAITVYDVAVVRLSGRRRSRRRVPTLSGAARSPEPRS